MICLYWKIGNQLLLKQKREGWETKVIDKLSKDLKNAFPEMKGLSARNLRYMRKFAYEYQDEIIMQQLAAQLLWFHNCVLLDKISDTEERIWYIKKTIENGWSHNVLTIQIQSNLYARDGKSINNFKNTLPSSQSDLTTSIVKDPYSFDFLSLGKEAHEREIEKELVKHIEKFLLELGSGFAFIGKQYQIIVEDESYFVDLLFYHLKLRCYVVVELKAGKFKPEYALRDINKPIGLAEYNILDQLPQEIKTSLPTIEELESELSKIEK